MTEGADRFSDRMAEVLRLSEALSHHVLNAFLADEPIPRDQATALIKAAQLLQDSEISWPSMLEQALHEVVDHSRRARATSEPHDDEGQPSEAVHDGGGNPLRVIPVLGKLFGGGKTD